MIYVTINAGDWLSFFMLCKDILYNVVYCWVHRLYIKMEEMSSPQKGSQSLLVAACNIDHKSLHYYFMEDLGQIELFRQMYPKNGFSHFL